MHNFIFYPYQNYAQFYFLLDTRRARSVCLLLLWPLFLFPSAIFAQAKAGGPGINQPTTPTQPTIPTANQPTATQPTGGQSTCTPSTVPMPSEFTVNPDTSHAWQLEP